MTLSPAEILLVLSALGLQAFWIATLIRLASMRTLWTDKMAWLLIIVFTHAIGAAAYWLYCLWRNRQNTMASKG